MRIPSRYELIVSVLLVLVVLEVLSLIMWIFFPYLAATGETFTGLDVDIFRVLFPFSPLLILLVLYGWVFEGACLVEQHTRLIHRVFMLLVRARDLLSHWIIGSEPSDDPGRELFRHPRVWLLLAVCSAILVVYTPYRNDLNPGQSLVGTDTPLYVGWVDQMLGGSLGQAISYAFGIANHGSRPFLLLPLYFVTLASGVNPIQGVEYLPLVLAPLSALSSYIFVRAGLKTENMAVLAAFLTVLSFPVTVGMWAGYFANWLALIEANLFFVSLLSVSSSFSASRYGILVGLSLALLLTHPWTWALAIVLSVVFVLTMLKTLHSRGVLMLLGPLLAINLTLDALKTYAFGGWGLATYVGVRVSGSGPLQAAGFWQNLVQGMVFTYDGLLSNAPILLLAFIAVLNLRFSDSFDRLMLLWISIPSLLFPFMASYNQTRIVYDLPIPILASAGTLLLVSRFKKRKMLSLLILILVVLFNANYTIRTMTQLVTAIP